MTRPPVACILCIGTHYAMNCANGECHAQQLQLPVDVPRGYGMTRALPPGRHDRGWSHG